MRYCFQIEFRWEELRRAFVSLDPHKTGCVSDREFQTIVNETCVHVSNTDLNKIMNSHAATDSRYCFLYRYMYYNKYIMIF